MTRSNVEADFLDTDGVNDNADDRVLENNGTKYPHKSWYFIHNSTIKGRFFSEDIKIPELYYMYLCCDYFCISQPFYIFYN